MNEELGLSELQSRLFAAFVSADPTLGDIYLSLRHALRDRTFPDRCAIVAYEARELMNLAALRLAVPSTKVPQKPETLAALKEELSTRYQQLQQQLETADASDAHVESELMAAFLEYIAEWLDRAESAKPSKRRLVKYQTQYLDPSHSAPHTKRFELIFERWNRLEGFFNRVLHHSQPTTDGELEQKVAELEDFFVQRICPRTFKDQQVLDSYLANDPSSLSSGDTERFLGLLEALDANYRYFFAKLSSPDWIAFLETNGFFQHPVPLEDHEGKLLALDWPELQYLERMTLLAPDEVARVALQISRRQPANPRIHDALLGIADKLFSIAPRGAKRLLNEELMWVKEQAYLHYLLPEKLLAAGISAAGANCSGTALRVARALLALETAETAKQSLLGANWIRMDQWGFHDILKKIVEDLLPQLHEPVQLELLHSFCESFDLVVEREFENEGKDLVDYVFQMWRPAIEDHSQNDPNDLKNWVIEAIRDAANYLVASHGQQVLTTLEKPGSNTLMRIAIFLRQQHPKLDPKGTSALVADPGVLENVTLRHELFLLLEHSLGTLSDSARNAYFEFIAGLSDRRKQQLFLWPIRANLPDAWGAVYRQLEEELGVLEHPDFPTYHETVWVGPTSPLSAEDMRQMPIEKLVTTLNEWTPPNEWHSPSPEGLARELAKWAAEDAERLSSQSEKLEGLKSTCVRGIAQGFADGAKQGCSILWGPVLCFCQWAVSQPRGEGPESNGLEDFDATWGPARKQIARLVQAGVKKGKAEIPFEHRNEVWSIIEVLVDDSDPTEVEEHSRSEYSDPSTIAINTVRGVAMNALVSYALWVARNAKPKTRTWESWGLPEVKEILEKRLERDPSRAIRSVYGKWLTALYRLDKDWLESNIARIFPLDEGGSPYWHAAWDAYLAFCSTLYLELLEVLRASYEHALSQLGLERPEQTRMVNPDERLGGHLALFYREGTLEREDSLFCGYFERAESKLRYSVMIDAVRQIEEIGKEKRAEVVDRLMKLWAWRFDEAIEETDVEYHELSSFSWWFLKDDFAPEWRLQRLLECQRREVKLELDGHVLEKLVELATDHLHQVLDCLDAIVRNTANQHWGTYDDHAKEILRMGLSSDDNAVRDVAEELIHYIGSLGGLSFRDLLTSHHGEES